MAQRSLEMIPFGGRSATKHPHLIGLDKSLIASDCFVDDDTISGRSGYRSLLIAAIVGTGTPQFMGRFNPTLSSVRTVIVISGDVWIVTDASSSTASDATATKIGTGTFGSTDNISGTQLGENFYLATDNATAKWVRIDSSFALHVLAQLPTAPIPSYFLSTLDLIYFNSLAAPTLSGITVSGTGVTNWESLAGTTGSTAQYDLTTGGGPTLGYDWANTTWLMMTISPETLSGGGTNFQVTITDTGGAVYPLGTISDPPNTNGSPWAVFFNMTGLGITANIKYVTFTQGVKASGSGADPFAISAFMAFPTAPEPGPVDYYVVYYNSVTGDSSSLSAPLAITYTSLGVTFAASQIGRWNYNTFQNIGIRSTNPDSMSVSDLFNKGEGLAYPASTDFAAVYTFTDTIPAGAQFPFADTVQLYRTTPNGISLVGSSIYTTRADGSAWTTGTGTASDFPLNYSFQTSGGTVWSITDNTGSTAEANPIYQPGGPGPQTTAMTAMADRIVAAYGNTVYISSFTPSSLVGNPVPQWPSIAVESADGWNFNITPAPNEQILDLQVDDPNYLYILTSARVMGMRSLAPNTVPFPVLDKGALGRHGSVVTDSTLWWASYDGLYGAIGSSWKELTGDVRIYLYIKAFAPNGAVVLGEQSRKLYAFQGRTFIRYDYVTQRWTTGTLADTVDMAISFKTLGDSEELWFLTASRFVGRMQPNCFRDMQVGTNTATGTQPPDWVFCTGFEFAPQPYIVKGVEVDTTGLTSISILRTQAGLVPMQARSIGPAQPMPNQDETWYPGSGDFAAAKMAVQFSAANGVNLIRAFWERTPIDRKGGTV